MPGLAAALVLFAACVQPARRAEPALATPWSNAFPGVGAVTILTLPEPGQPLALQPGTTLVVASEDAAAGETPFTSEQRAALRAFVAEGGKLLLLGHAARLAAACAIDSEWPEATTFRWGYDRRAGIGRAQLGFRVVSGLVPEPFDALRAAPNAEQTFFVAGGEPCTAPSCVWSIGPPKNGVVLARLATELDGELSEIGAPVVVQWSCVKGTVLACGLLPAIDHPDPVVRDNARAFLNGCIRRLRGRDGGPVVMMRQAEAPAPRLAAMASPFAPRTGPRVPLLAHWGWQAAARQADGGELRTTRELIDGVVVPSWLAGADLVELRLGDGGVVVPWAANDPLKPPPSWQVRDGELGLSVADVTELAAEAHARGMLIATQLDPLPVGERRSERLAALRFLARELADVRRRGAGALDGFGVRSWWEDTQGYGLAMVQDFHPGAFLYGAGERTGELAGCLRAMDADDGAPRGSGLAGISGAWRDGFDAGRFPVGVLDARARRERPDGVGGGSSGDWIVTQANDFVRDRRGLGAAMWWRRHDPSLLDPRTADYVHGVSQEPLVAAVAASLAATGDDGRRAAAAALLDPAPRGFGAETNVPAAVHVLRDNWFSLAGSGGALTWDRDGLARFRPGDGVVLAKSFLRSRLFGARPDTDAPLDESVDLLAAGRRGDGGYGNVFAVGADAAAQVPTTIAGDEVPAWPQGIAIDWRGEIGYHELELGIRPVRGSGVLAVSLDGSVLRCIPFRAGQPASTVTLPLHKAAVGVRTLRLEVVDGGAVAIDVLRTRRRGEVGVQASVQVPAGSHAVLCERSASGVHAERVELATIADFPGFLVRFVCERAARNLQVERTFGFTAHTRLFDAKAETPADALREPFVLRAPDTDLPDVVVVPLHLARHERFELGEAGLVLRSAPEAGGTSRIGFLFVPRDRSRTVARCSAAIVGAMDRPLVLDLGTTGAAEVTSDLPLPWSRIVQVPLPPSTPFAVRENGWWTWRGAQPSPDGGSWLRIRHEPGDTVQLVGGPSVFARTRPGPGSLHVVALKDPEPLRVTVRVLQHSTLCPPSVVMGQDFDEVRVNGESWGWFDGRTVFLPDRPGTYAVECRSRGPGPFVHVASTRAPLERCSYDTTTGALVLVVPPGEGRPPELPWTAVLRGPRPRVVENGEIVDDASLNAPDAAAAMRAGGVLIRFRSGVTRVVP